MRQQRMMKCRHQRRALPAQRHIPPAKIADGGYLCHGGDAVIIADLQGAGGVPFRFVPDGLSMTGDGGDLVRRHAGLLQ